MKTESKSITPLPESRWKWMAGSTAATVAAATASTAHAKTVQITQAGNTVSSAGASANPDLTGDGVTDIQNFISGKSSSSTRMSGGFTYFANFAYLKGGGERIASAAFTNRSNGTVIDGTNYFVSGYNVASSSGPNPKTLRTLFPVIFTDSRINGGAPSNGFADILAASLSPSNIAVTIVRLVFNDASPTAPTGITAGGTNKEWLTPAERAAVLGTISKLKRKAKKLKRKVRAANKSGNASNAQRLKKKLKKFRKMERVEADKL